MRQIRLLLLLLVAVLCLGGCAGWMDGSFASVSPHAEVYAQTELAKQATASNYDELKKVLIRLVQSGVETAVVDVSQYSAELEQHIPTVIRDVQRTDPLTAYAVSAIEIKTSEVGVRHVAAVTIQYSKTAAQLRAIDTAWGANGIRTRVEAALDEAKSGLTLRVSAYEELDLQHMAEQYYFAHLDTVMECPIVTVDIYPKQGNTRILDIQFLYTTPQQTLLSMADEVQVMLTSAAGYVRGQETQTAMAERLNSFLRPLYSQQGVTSTPVYSLLFEGIGDDRWTANVFQLLCQQVELNCWVVEGTLDGDTRFWNILELDGEYYHIDLLESWALGSLSLRYDDEMVGYAWQTEQYPACDRPENPPTAPTVPPPETEAVPDSSTEPEPTNSSGQPEETVPNTLPAVTGAP